MVEILQGKNYLKLKESFVNDVQDFEKRFDDELNEYVILYKQLAQGNMNEMQKDEIKLKIAAVNKRMKTIMGEMYTQILKEKKDKRKIKKFQNMPVILKKYEKIDNLYKDLNSKQKVATYDAIEEDFQLKAEMLRIRYIIWASLAVITFVSSIVWLVTSIEFPVPIKAGIIGIAALVGLGFITAIWAVALKYCQQATKKGIICSLINILNKFFKGMVDFFQFI